MRIPTYDSKVSPSGGQPYRSVPDVRNNGIGDLAKGIESIASEMKRREDEETAIADYTNMANADMAITQLGETLKDEIANGGKYADAEKRFNEGYSKILAQYSGVIKDPKSRAEFAVKTQRAGLQYNLQIKDARRTRIKSDATTAASNKMALLTENLARLDSTTGPVDPKARAAIINQMGSALAPLEGMGVIARGAGSEKIRNAVGDAKKTAIRIVAEQDPQSALKMLDDAYQSREIGADDYASMLGPVNNMVEAQIKQTQADTTVANWISGDVSKVPDRGDVDLFFQKNIMPSMEGLDVAGREQLLVDYASRVGMLPTAVENQLVSNLASYSPDMGAQDKAALASNARVVSNLDYSVIKKDGGLTDDDLMKSRIIASRLNSGMAEADAVDSVMKVMGDKDRQAVYTSATKELYSLADGAEPIGSRIESVNKKLGAKGSQSDVWRTAYEDAYASARMMGEGKKDAHSRATEAVRDRFGSFNGVVVENPPQSFGVPESILKKKEPVIIDAAKNAVRGFVPDVDNAKIILNGNRDTVAQRNMGTPYWDMDFVVSVVYPGEDYPTPVTDANGNVATMKLGTPKLGMLPKEEVVKNAQDVIRESKKLNKKIEELQAKIKAQGGQ